MQSNILIIAVHVDRFMPGAPNPVLARAGAVVPSNSVASPAQVQRGAACDELRFLAMELVLIWC